jgi:hypothetical protein
MVGEMSCNTATYISDVAFEVISGGYEDLYLDIMPCGLAKVNQNFRGTCHNISLLNTG